MNGAVFLDRDGTITVEKGFITRPEDLELLPGAAEGIARLRRAGFRIAVVTNQSAVARGLTDMATIERIHERLRALLEEHGAVLDAIFVCPHHPDFGPACECRKPAPGLILRALAEWSLDPRACWTVGDQLRDLEAGRAAGTRTALVRTGFGAEARADRRWIALADLAVRDLAEFSRVVTGLS